MPSMSTFLRMISNIWRIPINRLTFFSRNEGVRATTCLCGRTMRLSAQVLSEIRAGIFVASDRAYVLKYSRHKQMNTVFSPSLAIPCVSRRYACSYSEALPYPLCYDIVRRSLSLLFNRSQFLIANSNYQI